MRRRGSETLRRGPLPVMRTLYRTRKARGIGQAAHFHREHETGPAAWEGGTSKPPGILRYFYPKPYPPKQERAEAVTPRRNIGAERRPRRGDGD